MQNYVCITKLKKKKITHFLTNYETNNITKGCFLNVAILNSHQFS